jgi:hypothetical protein
MQPPTWLMTAWLTLPCVPQKPGVRQVTGWHEASLLESNVCTQPVWALHESSVQMLLSLQSTGTCTQPVAGLQLSVVHTLLSLQLDELSVWVHPVAGLQSSFVHALLSLQLIC